MSRPRFPWPAAAFVGVVLVASARFAPVVLAAIGGILVTIVFVISMLKIADWILDRMEEGERPR